MTLKMHHCYTDVYCSQKCYMDNIKVVVTGGSTVREVDRANLCMDRRK